MFSSNLDTGLNLPLVTTPTETPCAPNSSLSPSPLRSLFCPNCGDPGSHFTPLGVSLGTQPLPGGLTSSLSRPLDVSGQEAGLRSLVMTQTPDSAHGGCIPDDLVQAVPRSLTPQDGALCHRLISPNTEPFKLRLEDSQLPTMGDGFCSFDCSRHQACCPELPSGKAFLLQWQGILSASNTRLSAPSRMASAGENLLVGVHVA